MQKIKTTLLNKIIHNKIAQKGWRIAFKIESKMQKMAGVFE